MVCYFLAQSKISYIDVRFAVHATEDVNKVTEAVQNIMPVDYLDDIIFKSTIAEGHYGNPITFFEIRIKKEKITADTEKTFRNGKAPPRNEAAFGHKAHHFYRGPNRFVHGNCRRNDRQQAG